MAISSRSGLTEDERTRNFPYEKNSLSLERMARTNTAVPNGEPPHNRTGSALESQKEDEQNMAIELNTVDTAKILNGKIQLVRVNTILQQLGFRFIERSNRSPVALFGVPQWYYNATGDGNGFYNIRQLCDSALFHWRNRTVQPEPVAPVQPQPSFYDDGISPVFGMATTFDPSIYSSEPVEPVEEESPESQPLESEPQPLELAAPVVAVPANITAVVKVVNKTGKFEILESSHSNLVPVGKTYNSTVIGQKELGSLWLVNCHLSQGDSGSLKIDSIEPFERTATIAPVATIPAIVVPVAVPTENTPIVASEPLQSPESPIVGHASEPQPNRIITANLDEWLCPDYYISPNARSVFKFAVECIKHNPFQSVKVLMTGDPGYGKTTIAERLAQFLGFTCYRMNCAAIRDTEEWFFDREVKPKIVYDDSGQFLGLGTETLFTDSDFVEVLRRGNCVMILDEFNRIESNLHNSLFPLMDDSGATRLHHRDYIVGPNVIFVATVNLGRENSGTFLLDDALTNRFDMILEVRPLPYDHELSVLKARYNVTEEDANQIVKLATILRENEFKCSTRDTLKIAKIVSVGMAIRDAFEFVIVLRIPEDESNAPIRKALVDLVNKELGTRSVEFAFAS